MDGNLPASREQYVLDLGVEVEAEVNGIEMGVLENGLPFLTQAGLAEICGVARSVIYDITQEWEHNYDNDVLGKDRKSFIKQKLFAAGFTERRLYVESKAGEGASHYAYPDIVCMAVLEYYAFESRSDSSKALDSFRSLAAYGLQKFIYEALGYAPGDPWKYHNERVSILHDSVPDGYFSVFKEVTGLIVDLINAGLTVNYKIIPDISVGSTWGRFWKDGALDEKYGERIDYAHFYPDSFPQAKSNPQPAKAYPDAALPEFRQWFKRVYLPTKFPNYILGKHAALPGGKAEAIQIANTFKSKAIQ